MKIIMRPPGEAFRRALSTRAAGENVVEVPFEHFTRADAGLTCLMGVVY